MSLKRRIRDQIRHFGPISVAHYMALALHDPAEGYYATAQGIGGDFITAPAISQMFGELIGVWCAHEWRALGAPSPFDLIELGPGGGALISDALRAARRDANFSASAQLHLVELSPTLRAAQAQALQGRAHRHWSRLEEIPPAPSLIIANEFLDCFPIRQFVRDKGQWRERLVGAHPDLEDDLAFALSPDPLPDDSILPPTLRGAADGAIAEIAPGMDAFIDALADRLNSQRSRALFIDYGDAPGGDTLQAIAAHQKVEPLHAPGQADLTAHVDFAAVATLASEKGLKVDGPVPQGAWLASLGLAQRAEALARANPDRADRLAREADRLTSPQQMGSLFKVICLSSADTPTPAGF